MLEPIAEYDLIKEGVEIQDPDKAINMFEEKEKNPHKR